MPRLRLRPRAGFFVLALLVIPAVDSRGSGSPTVLKSLSELFLIGVLVALNHGLVALPAHTAASAADACGLRRTLSLTAFASVC